MPEITVFSSQPFHPRAITLWEGMIEGVQEAPKRPTEKVPAKEALLVNGHLPKATPSTASREED